MLRYFFILGVLALAIWAGSPIEAGKAETEAFSHMGRASGEGTRIACASWQKGNQVVLLGLSRLKGKTYGLAYAVALKLPISNSEISNTSGGTANEICVRQAFLTKGNKSFWLNYQISIKPAAEELTVGGQPEEVKLPKWAKIVGARNVPVEDGRVLLVDLTNDTPAVTQVRADLSAVLPSAREGVPLERNKEQMRDIIERLKAQSPQVRDFLQSR